MIGYMTWFRVLRAHDSHAAGDLILRLADIRTAMLTRMGLLEELGVDESYPTPEIVKLKPAEPPIGGRKRGQSRKNRQSSGEAVQSETGGQSSEGDAGVDGDVGEDALPGEEA
jgi:hypothetical protein